LLLTTRTETLLDCLGWLPSGDARTLADRAQQQRWLSSTDIERRLNDQPGRWGNKRLRSMLATIGDGAHSEAERRIHHLLRTAGMAGWRANYPVNLGGKRYVLDVAFPAHRIAVEVDGYRTHSERNVFQTDRTKDVHLKMAGWTVLRFTWWDVHERPEFVLAALTSLLAA
jgi:very-short-patch-repair endonuclease